MNKKEFKKDLKKLIDNAKEYIWILENDHGYDLENGKKLIINLKKKYGISL